MMTIPIYIPLNHHICFVLSICKSQPYHQRPLIPPFSQFYPPEVTQAD